MQTDAETQKYFDSIQAEVEKAYSIAGVARKKGKDPEMTVEILLAEDLAARVEGLISTFFPTLFGSGLKEGIRVLEEQYGKNDERVALLVGRDVAIGKYGDFGSTERFAEVGLRTAVAYLTLGVVTAPLEGISAVKIKKNDDGTDYLAVYYAGPIRSAGGTASAISVLAADFIRKALKLDTYKPSEIEVNRYFAEVEDYYNRVAAKQYHPTKEEMTAIIKNVPVEITGDPTEELEVSNYKDLPRVETNKIRGGMCLILLDGIPLKAEKVLGRVKKYPDDYDLKNWLWLADFVKLKNSIHAAKKVELKDSPNAAKFTPKDTYLSKVLAGRPIFSHPSKRGGFRLRYGRSRTGGLAATSIHSATMWLTEFIAVGTQIATEFPGKATVCAPCDTIEPPVVKLRNGSILELKTRKEVRENKSNVVSILSMGDVLVPYGEFVSNNHMLMPSAYCEEWWLMELKKAVEEKGAQYSSDNYVSKPPTLDEAFKISRELEIPLHPEYNFFWHDITIEELKELVLWFSTGVIINENDEEQLTLQKTESSRILEILCIPCTAKEDKAILSGKSLGAFYSLGKPSPENVNALVSSIEPEAPVISAVTKLAGIKIRERGLTRIGMRMGRPEKAEKRLLKGRPQILFPCGIEGGKMRNLMESYSLDKVTAEFPVFRCPSCNAEAIFPLCPKCNTRGKAMNVCQSCNALVDAKMHCNQPTKKYRKRTIKLKEILDCAFKNAAIVERPKLFKGVRGVSGPERSMECLEKGVLRTKYELYVNKDGTTRYDASDVSMTHFKPSELGVSVEKLKSIGYDNDYLGKPLQSESQILELKVQDIVISDNDEFSSVNYMINVSKFIDDLLVKVYGAEPYYNINSKEDLVGRLVVGLAPHTSAGIVGRIVGFTPSKVCYAHPFWHAGKRRNCFFGNEKILVNNGLEFELLEMRDFVEKNLVNEVQKDTFGTEHKRVSGIKTFAFNESTKNFELADITHVSKHLAPEKLLEIRTKSGRKIIVTPDHPMLNRLGKKIRAEDASEVLIPWHLDFPDNSKLGPSVQNLMKKWLNKKGNKRTAFEGAAFVDKIVEKRVISNKEKYVYDLTVDTHHNLICSGVVAGNCDGDEDSIMLLMDALLNFSRKFLPDTRGGRSVASDTIIYTVNGNSIESLPASKLIDNQILQFGAKIEEGFEVCRANPQKIEAICFDLMTKKVVRAPITAFIRHRIDKKMYEVKTANGKICVTEDHNMFVTRGGFIDNIKTSELKQGDRIVAPKYGIKRLRELISDRNSRNLGYIKSERVVSIKEIPYKDKYVYDLEVPKHQNFLCGPHPLFVHNTMDACLVLTSRLNPEEVDDEAWKVDVSSSYPLEFYEATMGYKTISELTKKPRLVADVIKTPEVFHIKFTHDTSDVNDAPIRTKYVELGSMTDKVSAQLSLAEKIVAVNKDAVAEAVISKHFLRDIKGNLRTFSEQKVRCSQCNAKYRRVPLIGKCYCGGKLMLSVSEGAIRKYIEPTKHIIEKYKISPYLFQQFSLLEKDIDSLFGKKARQLGLGKFGAK